MRALYRIESPVEQPKNCGNTGLWYDKYCDEWPEIEGCVTWSLKSYKDGNQDINPKQRWIDGVARSIGDGSALEDACNRVNQLAARLGVKEPQCFKTQWRFITGLGREHPVENGFAWHHTLGVPYLPGSSIKGMVRAWAEEWRDFATPDIGRIFGPVGAGEVGSVLFFDALPVGPVRVEADIMTPHYTRYYSDGEMPGDWDDPVPIPFLAVAANQEFQFIIGPRRSQDEASRNDAETVRGWLREALEWIGAGAKTAVGYGRFKPAGTLSGQANTERWINARIHLEPGSNVFTAFAEGISATGKTDALQKWKKGQNSNTLKKLRQGRLIQNVEVTREGNRLSLIKIVSSE